MKISQILPNLAGIALVAVMLGCNDLGPQLAKILPSKDDSAQLSEADDADAIDPSQRGGGNTSMAQLGANESVGVDGFSDGPMNEDYSEMIGNFEADMAMEGMEDGGTLMGVNDEQQIMQMDDPTGGFEGGADTDMTAQMNMLEPANLGGGDGTPGYLQSLGGGMLEPPLDNFVGEQSLGGFGGGVGGMEKPKNGRGPQKRLPAKTTQSGTPAAAIRPNSENPSSGRPASQPKGPAAGIRIPGNITSPAYSLINSVATPLLSQNGTVMTFSTEILQQQNRTSRGTVYCVVHSQQLGFMRVPVSSAGGRVNVGSKFTPTSGPFKAFIVSVDANGEIKYLSSAVNIQWNP